MSSVCGPDFARGRWRVEVGYVIDETTGRKFSNDSEDVLFAKLCQFPVCTIPYNAMLTAFCMTGRFFRVLSFYHCCKSGVDPTRYQQLDAAPEAATLTKMDRAKDVAVDILKTVGGPFLCLATQGTMVVGALASPCTENMRDFRKWIDSLDRLQFDSEFSAIACLGSKRKVDPPPPPQHEMS